MSLDFSQLRKAGTVIEFQNAPHVILKTNFQRTAQRKPVVQAKLRNLITGRTLEYNFKFGEKIEAANVSNRKGQYLYKDNEGLHFMDSETFENVILTNDLAEGLDGFLKDGMEVNMVFYENGPISIDLPAKIDLKVITTPPGVKGDTATGGTKPATLETGLVVQVPLFIKDGETVRINTTTSEYVERAS